MNIYSMYNKETGKTYLGKTDMSQKEFENCFTEIRLIGRKIHDALKQYAVDCWEIEFIETGLTERKCNTLLDLYVREWKPEYNEPKERKVRKSTSRLRKKVFDGTTGITYDNLHDAVTKTGVSPVILISGLENGERWTFVS